MTEVYETQTKQGLLSLYVEARQTGANVLSDEVWDKLVEMDRHETKEKLAALRIELNNSLLVTNSGSDINLSKEVSGN